MSHPSLSQIGLSSVIPERWTINLLGERDSDESWKSEVNPLWYDIPSNSSLLCLPVQKRSDSTSQPSLQLKFWIALGFINRNH